MFTNEHAVFKSGRQSSSFSTTDGHVVPFPKLWVRHDFPFCSQFPLCCGMRQKLQNFAKFCINFGSCVIKESTIRELILIFLGV